MPDYFIVDADSKPIPASSDEPTTLHNLSGDSLTLTNLSTGGESSLAVGSETTLTAAHRARSLGARVSMTRS